MLPQPPTSTLSLHDALPISPDNSFFDVRDWMRLSINDNGQAEWAVLRGPHESSGVIESEAERQARNELTRARAAAERSEEHTSELQSQSNLVCRLLLEKKKK